MLETIKPFLEYVVSALAGSLNAEAAIIDDQFNLISCTENYLQHKGREVHSPSVEQVLNMGTMVISTPGKMPTCSGCRFHDKCPASLEILNSITLEERPIGLISLSLFGDLPAGQEESEFEFYAKPLKDTARLIAEFLKHELTQQQFQLYQEMLLQTMEMVTDGVVAVNQEGEVIHQNRMAREILASRNLTQQQFREMIQSGEPFYLPQGGDFKNLHNAEQQLSFQISPVSQSRHSAFNGALIRFKPCDDSADSKALLQGGQEGLNAIIGTSTPILQLKEQVRKISKTDSTVLITGETGTGKELFAKAIHLESNRNKMPFIAINCAAIPEQLLESELFGYEGGSFTGAERKGKAGYFEIANGGTLLLDEVGDMPLNLQAKLLRVLQEKTIRRIGAKEDIPLDLKVVAASNQNMAQLVQENRFRQDLYYRLNVIPLTIPSLRERREDIADLALFFLKRFNGRYCKKMTGFTDEAKQLIHQHTWPGNVRELENAVEYAINMSTEEMIDAGSLPPYLVSENPGDSLLEKKQRIEKEELQQLFNRYGDDLAGKEQVAKALNISIRTLYRRIKALGVGQDSQV